MSTRANVIIEDKHSSLYFYRHSDGYPECTLKSLRRFMRISTGFGATRANVSQAGGWLIILGAIEYQTLPEGLFPENKKNVLDRTDDVIETVLDNLSFTDWKVGAYEPTTRIHGDVEFVYVLDLAKSEIRVYRAGDGEIGELLATVTKFDVADPVEE